MRVVLNGLRISFSSFYKVGESPLNNECVCVANIGQVFNLLVFKKNHKNPQNVSLGLGVHEVDFNELWPDVTLMFGIDPSVEFTGAAAQRVLRGLREFEMDNKDIIVNFDEVYGSGPVCGECHFFAGECEGHVQEPVTNKELSIEEFDKIFEGIPDFDTMFKGLPFSDPVGDVDVGIKHDLGKPRLTLIPQNQLRGVVKVFEHGAKKYGEYNWKKGLKFSRLIDAVYRHIDSFVHGQVFDPESNQAHLHHAIANLFMLSSLSMSEKREELNDLENIL